MAEPPPVQGFMYESATDPSDERNETVCKVTGRAGKSDGELREYGQMFWVEFGDGEVFSVYAHELTPWWPID